MRLIRRILRQTPNKLLTGTGIGTQRNSHRLLLNAPVASVVNSVSRLAIHKNRNRKRGASKKQKNRDMNRDTTLLLANANTNYLAPAQCHHHVQEQTAQLSEHHSVAHRTQGACCQALASYGQSRIILPDDPVYVEDNGVFFNLILKEAAEMSNRRLVMVDRDELLLSDRLRHCLLSWMLNVCELQMCQDEIFPLATMILDKFLLYHSPINSLEDISLLAMTFDEPRKQDIELHCKENELNRRQLCLFAACSLLLATKLRQTPRLCVQALIEFSRDELPLALSREEILDGELLILATLKWDLAALVTPNDFLTLLWGKCNNLIASTVSTSDRIQRGEDRLMMNGDHACISVMSIAPATCNNDNMHTTNRHDESRVKRHTQTLLELCLMGK